MNFLYRPEEVITMANVKSCERNLQISILKQILRQLPAQIPRQIPRQKQRQNLKIPNLKKVIPLELIQRPPLPICFGYKSKKDECGICKRCFYNQYRNIEISAQYYGNSKSLSEYSCPEKTRLNKTQMQQTQFRKTQKKVMKEEIDIIVKNLKNL